MTAASYTFAARENELQDGHAPHQPGTPAHKIQSTAGTPVKGSAPVGVPGAASPVRSNRGAVPNPWLETGQSIVVNGQLVPVVTQAYLDSLLACGEKPKTPSVAVRSATPSMHIFYPLPICICL